MEEKQVQQIHAPASLIAALEGRLAQRDLYLSEQISADDLATVLPHTRWEIQSAVIERLGAGDGKEPHAVLINALQHENHFVRMTAVRTLRKMDVDVSRALLLAALQDHNWQVREMAVLTLREVSASIPQNVQELLLHDASSAVREAASMVLQPIQIVKKSPDPCDVTQERSKPIMSSILWVNHTKPKRQRKFRWKSPVSALVACIMFFLILTAAGTISGWWNPLFGGDPNVYQTLELQQSNQGITIKVTKVYADEGRTIIAYDIYGQDPTQSFNVIHFDLSSTVPQHHEILQSTQCDAPQNGVRHCYMVQPDFQVPANSTTLQLDWKVMQVARDGSPSVLSGIWHFSFQIPFHHENKQGLPNPIHNGIILYNVPNEMKGLYCDPAVLNFYQYYCVSRRRGGTRRNYWRQNCNRL